MGHSRPGPHFSLPTPGVFLFIQRTETGALVTEAGYFNGSAQPLKMTGPQGMVEMRKYQEYVIAPGTTFEFPNGFKITLDRLN